MTIKTRQKTVSVHTAQLDSFDPDAMTETVQRSSIDHTLLHKGRFKGDLLHAQLDSTRLDWGSYNLPLMASGPLASDRITLGFLLHSAEPCSFNGATVQAGSMLVFSENHELHTRLAAGSSWLALQLERELLESAGVDIPQHLYALPQIDKVTSFQLVNTLTQSLDDISHSDISATHHRAQSMRDIEDAMLSCLAGSQMQAQPAAYSGLFQLNNALEIVRAAEAYIDTHLGERITIVEICSAIDCHIHNLERAFTKIHGISPKKFLCYRRLTRFRRLLLSSPPACTSVTEAALDCGLTHLGRAAVTYRSVFGETPSQTLANTTCTTTLQSKIDKSLY